MKQLNIIGLILWIVLGVFMIFADEISKVTYFCAWLIALISFIEPLINKDGD